MSKQESEVKGVDLKLRSFEELLAMSGHRVGEFGEIITERQNPDQPGPRIDLIDGANLAMPASVVHIYLQRRFPNAPKGGFGPSELDKVALPYLSAEANSRSYVVWHDEPFLFGTSLRSLENGHLEQKVLEVFEAMSPEQQLKLIAGIAYLEANHLWWSSQSGAAEVEDSSLLEDLWRRYEFVSSGGPVDPGRIKRALERQTPEQRLGFIRALGALTRVHQGPGGP